MMKAAYAAARVLVAGFLLVAGACGDGEIGPSGTEAAERVGGGGSGGDSLTGGSTGTGGSRETGGSNETGGGEAPGGSSASGGSPDSVGPGDTGGSSGGDSAGSGGDMGTGGQAGGLPMPVFSPAAGPFYGATQVTIAAAGASIRYTTDGTTPTETHGTLYAGRVTMEPAVNTNMTASSASNASGVTMLKAVAYKDGGQVSPVFTGNYIVISPLRYAKSSSLILGLAHIAYNVSSQNWDSVLGTWTKYLGYDTVLLSKGFALVKINDQQYIELYQRPITSPQYQLANWGFQVSDAEALRQQLSKAGIKVPSSCTANALGNLSFVTTDPDGHVNEWVQYLPDSVTGKATGQHMPGTQLFGYLENFGDATADVAAAGSYYSKCGLDGGGQKVYLPNNNCYLEMLTYQTLTQQQAGKHEKAQLVTFRGMDLLKALDLLKARDPSITQVRSTEGGGSFPNHNCGDVYNRDLSRIRMIDINY